MTSANRWWIGGNDVFEWTSGQNITYANWGLNQPDDKSSGVPNADCIQYYFRKKYQSFEWYDHRCDNVRSSICESKAFI